MLFNQRFKYTLDSCDLNVKICTVTTLNFRLWERFQHTLNKIKIEVSRAEFLAITFDGWSTHRNDSVLKFMLSYLDEKLNLITKCAGNIKLNGTHTGYAIFQVINRVFHHRLGNAEPAYFISDSLPLDKLAVRLHKEDKGDQLWFPCTVKFSRLLMREAVSSCLGISADDKDKFNELERYNVNDDEILKVARK